MPLFQEIGFRRFGFRRFGFDGGLIRRRRLGLGFGGRLRFRRRFESSGLNRFNFSRLGFDGLGFDSLSFDSFSFDSFSDLGRLFGRRRERHLGQHRSRRSHGLFERRRIVGDASDIVGLRRRDRLWRGRLRRCGF